VIGGAREVLDFAEAVIKLPPLRERPSDIPLLVNFFLERYNWQYAKEIKLNAPAMTALSNYAWPGNVLELKLLIKRLVLSAPEVTVGLESLPLDILIKTVPGAGADFVDRFEKAYVHRILEINGRNKTAAAAWLGLSPSVLETKL
jgi:transcriptional regulator with PAS, ATPase and Fis domain